MSDLEVENVSRKNLKRPEKYKPQAKTKITGRPKTVTEMERKGNFLVDTFGGELKISDLIEGGQYTARAWSAYDVDERPPKNLIEAKLLAQKGERYLARVFRLRNNKK